jgi:hypothetical protein
VARETSEIRLPALDRITDWSSSCSAKQREPVNNAPKKPGLSVINRMLATCLR